MRPLLSDPVEVAPVLLAHLREALAAPHLEYAEPPDPIAVGAETWIFGLEFRGAGREYRELGVAELVIPDYTLGRREQMFETMDRFIDEVAAPYH